ncbi:MAG: hypothetical protein GY699_12090 [Desulfobacteraceae bacterium]|nr:hypothetical protein [Desulfobacteraceae bacterium]
MNENSQNQRPHQQHPQGYPPPLYYYPPPYEEDEINLLDLWRVIWGSKWLIMSITVLCTGIAVTAALLMTPIYRSEVLMAPVTDEQSSRLSSMAGQFGGLAALAGINIGGDSGSKDEAIALLKSRALTEQFIKDEKLLTVLFYKDWDAENKKWDVKNKDDIPTMGDAYRKFNEDIRIVSVDRKTGLVTLAIEWTDPKLAANWAAELVTRVNSQMRDRAITDAKKSLQYLNKELNKTSAVEMVEAIYSLIEGQIKTIMFANVRDEYSFKLIDPPVVADLDDEIWPKKKLMVAIGCLVGFFLGVCVAFIVNLAKQNSYRENGSS